MGDAVLPPPARPAGTPAAVAARLRAGAAGLGVPLDDTATSRLLAFATEILRWNARVNLIGPADLETVATRHLLDSLAPLPVLRRAGVRRLADVGSGAGLPGLVLAVVEPGLQVVSIEPRIQRAAFQRHVVRHLALDNVQVVAARVTGAAGSPDRPGVPGAPFDAVLGRAVAALPEFLLLAAPAVRSGGLVVAMRGPRGDEEAAAAAASAARVGLALEGRQEYRLPGDRGDDAKGRTRLLLVYRAASSDPAAPAAHALAPSVPRGTPPFKKPLARVGLSLPSRRGLW
jgi:16S rRNA (guanine527-N7)-methyltransferase